MVKKLSLGLWQKRSEENASDVYIGEPVNCTKYTPRDSTVYMNNHRGGLDQGFEDLSKLTADSSQALPPMSPLLSDDNEFEFIQDASYEDKGFSQTLPRKPKPKLKEICPEIETPETEKFKSFGSSLNMTGSANSQFNGLLTHEVTILDEYEDEVDRKSGGRTRRDTMESREFVDAQQHLPVNYSAFTLEKANARAKQKLASMIPDQFKANLRIISFQKKIIRLETNELTFERMMHSLDPEKTQRDRTGGKAINSQSLLRTGRPDQNQVRSLNLPKKHQSMRVKDNRQFDQNALTWSLNQNRRKSDSNRPNVKLLKKEDKPIIEMSVRRDDFSSLMSAITGQPKSNFLDDRIHYTLKFVSLKIKSCTLAEIKHGGRDVPMKGRAMITKHNVFVDESTRKDVRYPIVVFYLPVAFATIGKQVRQLDKCLRCPEPGEEEKVVSFDGEGVDVLTDIAAGPKFKLERSYRHQLTHSNHSSPKTSLREKSKNTKSVDDEEGGLLSPETPRRDRNSHVVQEATEL